MPTSTDVLDPVSIKMAAIYINTGHEQGYKWVDHLLAEHQLQFDYLRTLQSKGGYLSVDGNRLKQYSQQSISELTILKNKMGKVILEEVKEIEEILEDIKLDSEDEKVEEEKK